MGNANPGGPGGRRKRIQTNRPMGKTSHRGQSNSSWPLGKLLLIGLAMLVIAILLFLN